MNLQHRTLLKSIGLGFVMGSILHANGQTGTTSILFGLLTISITLAYAALDLTSQALNGRTQGNTPPKARVDA